MERAMLRASSDPAPLTLGVIRALLKAATRELVFGVPAVSREVRFWRTRAERIPDRILRQDALNSITHKRDHIEGAALFWVLSKHRHRSLLRLLVAYQTIIDYLDSVSERHTSELNGRQLHLALAEALDFDAPISDYYRHNPSKDDGGYLRALVETCRACCAALPSYSRVRSHVLAGATLFGGVQSVNHCDPRRRDVALRAWAEGQPASGEELTWFELAAAASARLPHALLALAAECSCDELDITEAMNVHFGPAALLMAMLDSYADQRDDAVNGDHSYISYYGSLDAAVERLSGVIDHAVRQARTLRNGDTHATIIACMIVMNLSRDGARTAAMRARTRRLLAEGGSLTRLLLPVMYVWRAGYLKRASTGARPRTTRKKNPTKLPPGPWLPAPVQTLMAWKFPLAYLERCRDRYGSCFTVNITSHPPLVFICDAKEIRTLLAAPVDVLHPGEGANTVEPIVGQESFMLLDGDDHLYGRRTILPLFRSQAVTQHAEMIYAIAQREVESWPRGVPFALHPRLRALTLHTALRAAFGISGRVSERRLAQLHEQLLSMLAATGSAVFPEPLLRHGPGRKIWTRFLCQRAEVDKLVYDIIKERDHTDDGAESVLDRLLNARGADGSTMPVKQVRDNLMSMILAGHETTAAQLAWAFQLLAHNPAVLERLIDEIDADAGDEYLTATIHEVLRHRPVFLFAIPRTVKRPINIGGGIYRPPAQLLACIYLLHHDPALYPEPHRFSPERFLKAPPAATSWLPWGGGRKQCPGRHLAMLEMKTILRTVLANMTVRPAAKSIEQPRWRSVIVTPALGSRVVLQQRHNSNPPR
jgi:cytochrome P450